MCVYYLHITFAVKLYKYECKFYKHIVVVLVAIRCNIRTEQWQKTNATNSMSAVFRGCLCRAGSSLKSAPGCTQTSDSM